MTDKDKLQYVEVLLALAGFGNLDNEKKEDDSTSDKLVTNWPIYPINTSKE